MHKIAAATEIQPMAAANMQPAPTAAESTEQKPAASELPSSHVDVDISQMSVEGVIKACKFLTELHAQNPELATTMVEGAQARSEELNNPEPQEAQGDQAQKSPWASMKAQHDKKVAVKNEKSASNEDKKEPLAETSTEAPQPPKEVAKAQEPKSLGQETPRLAQQTRHQNSPPKAITHESKLSAPRPAKKSTLEAPQPAAAHSETSRVAAATIQTSKAEESANQQLQASKTEFVTESRTHKTAPIAAEVTPVSKTSSPAKTEPKPPPKTTNSKKVTQISAQADLTAEALKKQTAKKEQIMVSPRSVVEDFIFTAAADIDSEAIQDIDQVYLVDAHEINQEATSELPAVEAAAIPVELPELLLDSDISEESENIPLPLVESTSEESEDAAADVYTTILEMVNKQWEQSQNDILNQVEQLDFSQAEESELPNTQASDSADFRSYTDQESAIERPSLIESMQDNSNNAPLAETFMDLAKLLKVSDTSEVDSETEPVQSENTGEFIEEVQLILQELQSTIEQIAVENPNQIINPQTTKLLVTLLDKLGYKKPEEVLVEAVRANGLEFLLQGIEYLCEFNGKQRSQEFTSAQSQITYVNQSVKTSLGGAVLRFLAGQPLVFDY